MHLELKSSACALVATLTCTFLVSTGCGPDAVPEEESTVEVATVRAPLSGSYPFNPSNTNSAQQNTEDRVISVNEGETVTMSTCGTGASSTGDTYLRALNAAGQEMTANDDDDRCGGQLSYLKFTVPALATGNYTLRAGCFSSGSCGGTITWEVTPGSAGSIRVFSFNVTNTDSAQQNTKNHKVSLTAGQLLKLGTSQLPEATYWYQTDTVLRLFGPSGTQVAWNDDVSPSELGSYLEYTVPSTGIYEIRAGCYGSQSCGGTVAYTID